jgi:hypothetical protein
MGPVFVVMGHEYLENTRKVLLVQNEHPIQTFRTDGAHESLSVSPPSADASAAASLARLGTISSGRARGTDLPLQGTVGRPS